MRNVVQKIECSLCSKKILDTATVKTEHMYQRHPVDFLKNIMRSAPKAQAFGAIVGDALRKALENAR